MLQEYCCFFYLKDQSRQESKTYNRGRRRAQGWGKVGLDVSCKVGLEVGDANNPKLTTEDATQCWARCRLQSWA
jgi:hypothetical protein